MMEWQHTECGCARSPFVGSRYRRMSRDILTGEEKGWRYYTVTKVDPQRSNRAFCRRAVLVSDCGWQGYSFVQDLLTNYEALDNVVQMPNAKSPRR